MTGVQTPSSAGVSTGLPAVNQALEPEWVRHGSAATQKAYESALSFEQTLVEQLSQTLVSSSGLSGESSGEGEAGSEEGGSAGNAQLSSALPQALSAGIMKAGGLGLAAQMTRTALDTSAQSASQVGTSQVSTSQVAAATHVGAVPAPTSSTGAAT
jgi:hypothetical protein